MTPNGQAFVIGKKMRGQDPWGGGLDHRILEQSEERPTEVGASYVQEGRFMGDSTHVVLRNDVHQKPCKTVMDKGFKVVPYGVD